MDDGAAFFGNRQRSARPGGTLMPGSGEDGLYFELEAFLDHWRHHGIAEEVVRAALERARRTSFALEDVGKRLQGVPPSSRS